jgi:hypothetical protein
MSEAERAADAIYEVLARAAKKSDITGVEVVGGDNDLFLVHDGSLFRIGVEYIGPTTTRY